MSPAADGDAQWALNRFLVILGISDDEAITTAIRRLDEGSRTTLEACLQAARNREPAQPGVLPGTRAEELVMLLGALAADGCEGSPALSADMKGRAVDAAWHLHAAGITEGLRRAHQMRQRIRLPRGAAFTAPGQSVTGRVSHDGVLRPDRPGAPTFAGEMLGRLTGRGYYGGFDARADDVYGLSDDDSEAHADAAEQLAFMTDDTAPDCTGWCQHTDTPEKADG
jgi:hypothetical protein